ncbi:hypothetical protein SESBI_42417 [Sesbania bispinosa]|nr:hypothetical protein SESBI_42417 [Sesbania bispinosa]
MASSPSAPHSDPMAGAAKLGWGFCSLDSILLGSALVPFGLIYPKIGISWFSIRSSSSKGQVQLSLTILDVNGSPIEYNCCDLNLMDFEVLGRGQDIQANPDLQGGGGCEWKERLWNLCSDGIAKLQVKVVRRPFTVSSALLSVLGDPHVACDFGGAIKDQYVRTTGEAEICESDPNLLVASAGINTDVSGIQDDAVLDFRSETSEAFFGNLSNKIHQGIESEVIDLGALAERLVNSSVYWLYQKVDREAISQSHSPLKGNNACGSMVASELIKLLLREPKEIAAEHKAEIHLLRHQMWDLLQ